ncbi:MAG: hypothetical protein JW846_09815 [Dehalococcoidia bacterium]|nr:hypothetical protein [Dehalococcoidia bacterium]
MKAFWSNWQVRLGMALIVVSAAVYMIHYAIFRDAHHIFLYLVGDIAFVFIEVLMVTLILHELLSQREKRQRMEKMNMVIGAFYSEVGTGLLQYMVRWDSGLDEVRNRLQVTTLWTEEQFDQVETSLKGYAYKIDHEKLDVAELRTYLSSKVDFLLRLMENPNLLEHESFTNLLMAVFHLTEELIARGKVASLPDADKRHLAGDVERVYGQLVARWLDYMEHLKGNYPYLFSLAVRTNPFDEDATAVVQ